MRFHEVYLKNFVSYQEASVRFPLGVTAIVGDNGAGKTTILDAITYSVLRKHSRGVVENLIRRGADRARVSVSFSVKERKYRVEWALQEVSQRQATSWT